MLQANGPIRRESELEKDQDALKLDSRERKERIVAQRGNSSDWPILLSNPGKPNVLSDRLSIYLFIISWD